MFHDSEIAKVFTCGRLKQAYLVNYAIAPFCVESIWSDIDNSYYSIGFEETDGKMMIIVKYIKDGLVVTEMLDLVVLDNLNAESCAKAIINSIDQNKLRRLKCISDFSDSCNTMRGKFLE